MMAEVEEKPLDRKYSDLCKENENLKGKLKGYQTLGRLLMNCRQENQALVQRNDELEKLAKDLHVVDRVVKTGCAEPSQLNDTEEEPTGDGVDTPASGVTDWKQSLGASLRMSGAGDEEAGQLCAAVGLLVGAAGRAARASREVELLRRQLEVGEQGEQAAAVETEQVTQNTSELLTVRMGDRIKSLEAKVTELLTVNYRWDEYCRKQAAEHEVEVDQLKQRICELEQEHGQLQQLREEHQVTLRQLEDISAELETRQQSPQVQQQVTSPQVGQLRAEVDLLQAQLRAYTEDFAAERADRAAARGELDSAFEEIQRLRRRVNLCRCDVESPPLLPSRPRGHQEDAEPPPPYPCLNENLVMSDTKRREAVPVPVPPPTFPPMAYPPQQSQMQMGGAASGDAERPALPGTMSPWNCEQCTYKNKPGSRCCTICGCVYRPPPYNPYSMTD